jgi:hypothetical protein
MPPIIFNRLPIIGRRVSSIFGGILMVFDATLALMLGMFLIIEGWLVGLVLVIAFVLAVVGAASVFRCSSKRWILLGGLALVSGGLSIMPFEWNLIGPGTIGIIFALVSMVFIWLGWEDMWIRREFRLNPHAFIVPNVQVGPLPPPQSFDPAVGGVELRIRK